MDSTLQLLRTLKMALKQFEAAGLQTGPDGDSVCHALRTQIEFWRLVEEGDDQVMRALENALLDRKGILVWWASGQKVRTILKNKGFERLSQEVSNETLIGLLGQNSDYYDWTTAVRENVEKIEQEAARDAVEEELGLDWPDSKDPPSSTASASAQAT
jgi:hypothetical protein